MKEVFVQPTQRFSLKARARSFVHAWNGIVSFFATGQNAQLHLLATVVVVFLAVAFKISKTEAIAILFSIALVWIAEMFNTCFEKAMDFVSTEKHPQIKLIKDMAAGAVLIASIAALITGLVIFIPKFFAS